MSTTSILLVAPLLVAPLLVSACGTGSPREAGGTGGGAGGGGGGCLVAARQNPDETDRPGACDVTYCAPTSLELGGKTPWRGLLTNNGHEITAVHDGLATDLEIVDNGPADGPRWARENVTVGGMVEIEGAPPDAKYASVAPKEVEVRSIDVTSDHADVELTFLTGYAILYTVHATHSCGSDDDSCLCAYTSPTPLTVHLSLALD
jgi:hypothetical protein